MIKRPLDSRFSDKVLDGRKVTTIRKSLWPVGVPIMLYNWSGKPYRSKHVDVCPVVVEGCYDVRVSNTEGVVGYEYAFDFGRPVHELEGFESSFEMDEWFRRVVRPDQVVDLVLMKFRFMRDYEDE